MKKLFSILIICIAFLSCNRTRMDHDLKKFVGTWQWVQTKWVDASSAPLIEHVIKQEDVLDIYTVKIKTSGKMIYYKNDEVVEEIDIKVSQIQDMGCYYIIEYNGSQNNQITYSSCNGIEQICLIDVFFPIEIPSSGGTPESIFKKQ